MIFRLPLLVRLLVIVPPPWLQLPRDSCLDRLENSSHNITTPKQLLNSLKLVAGTPTGDSFTTATVKEAKLLMQITQKVAIQ